MPKCADCGYLTALQYHPRMLIEVDRDFRRTGNVPPDTQRNARELHRRSPQCFVSAFDLEAEHEKLASDSPASTLAVISCERNCTEFQPYLPGFSPKEQREMYDRQWMRAWQHKVEQEDRQYRDEQLRKDQEWREKQSREEHAWRKAQESSAEQRHRSQIVWTVVFTAGLSTIIVGIVQIVCTLIQVSHDQDEVRQPDKFLIHAPLRTVTALVENEPGANWPADAGGVRLLREGEDYVICE